MSVYPVSGQQYAKMATINEVQKKMFAVDLFSTRVHKSNKYHILHYPIKLDFLHVSSIYFVRNVGGQTV